MTIKDDYQSLKQWLRQASPTVKVIAVVWFITTISNIASLSDAVFQWKGFILDGVEFYRRWITDPLHGLLVDLDPRLIDVNADLLALSILCSIGFLRVCLHLYRNIRSGIDNADFSEEEKRLVQKAFATPIRVIVALESITWPLRTIAIFGLSTQNHLASLLFVAISSLPWVVAKDFRSHFIGPLTLAIVVVLALGAINAGLLRT